MLRLRTICLPGILACLFTTSAVPAATELTAEIWNAFSQEQQLGILNDLDVDPLRGEFTGYKIVSFPGLVDVASIYYKPYRQYVRGILDVADSEVSKEEIEQSTGAETGFATVGTPSVEVQLLTLVNGYTILGAMVHFAQAGAHKEDATWDDAFHYDDAAQAEAAGFDPHADVSWQAHAAFDEKMEIYPGDNYYEWSGW